MALRAIILALSVLVVFGQIQQELDDLIPEINLPPEVEREVPGLSELLNMSLQKLRELYISFVGDVLNLGGSQDPELQEQLIQMYEQQLNMTQFLIDTVREGINGTDYKENLDTVRKNANNLIKEIFEFEEKSSNNPIASGIQFYLRWLYQLVSESINDSFVELPITEAKLQEVLAENFLKLQKLIGDSLDVFGEPLATIIDPAEEMYSNRTRSKNSTTEDVPLEALSQDIEK